MRYPRMKRILFTPAATSQWLKLAETVRQRINARLEQFAQTGHGDVKKLKGRTGARLRAGDLARDLLRRG
jgi:mRNA interferase RelE/StbE